MPLLHAIVPKFPDIVVHDKCTARRHFEKIYTNWAASNYHLRVGLRRPIRLQENNSHLEINTNHVYANSINVALGKSTFKREKHAGFMKTYLLVSKWAASANFRDVIVVVFIGQL